MLIRSLLRLAAGVALVALLPAAPHAAGTGLQYDELVRVVIGATPPPPGTFAADVAALSSPAPAPTPAPRKARGLGAIASAVLSGRDIAGAAADVAVSNALDAQADRMIAQSAGAFAGVFRGLTQGRLERHAYLNGWERIDDVAAQTATIRKCDLNQVVTLDLAKKTYHVDDPRTDAAATPAPESAPRQHAATSRKPDEPGTAVADFTQTVRPLGQTRLDGIPATGYDDASTFTMSQATGSCRNGTFGFQTTSYYSGYVTPRAVCPIAPAAVRPRYPQTPVNVVASGGCRPTFTAHKSGPVPPSANLALYAAMHFVGGTGATPAPAASPGGFTFVTERGNVKPLASSDARLFDIPPDFTKAP